VPLDRMKVSGLGSSRDALTMGASVWRGTNVCRHWCAVMLAVTGAHESERHAQRLLWGQESPRGRVKESDDCFDDMLVGGRGGESGLK
jgi:hypothetical protein